MVAREPRGHFLGALLARPELWIALLVATAGAYFHGGASWNQNARLDAIYAFVEPGPDQFTFRIDRFLPAPNRSVNTGDWSRVGDHYYANKAPGTILLGALVYGPVYLLGAAFGLDPEAAAVASLSAYLINFFVSVAPLALASAALYQLFSRWLSPRRAALVTLVTFFGTALFPYSTQLWGHTTAAAFGLVAWWSFCRGSLGRSPLWDGATGWLAGMAVLCDFLAAPTPALIGLGLVLRRPRRLGPYLLGGLFPLALLLAYQWYCFGSPWALPTSGTRDTFLSETRALGLFGSPSGSALLHLTASGYRGLFFQMPVLIAALAGYPSWLRRRPKDFLAWGSLSTFAATLLAVASFNGWHGGASVCARYLLVAIPLLALGLAPMATSRPGLWCLAAAAVPSTLNMLAVAAVGPLAPDQLRNPLREFIYPHFWAGELHPYPWPVRLAALRPDFETAVHWTVWNWGDALALEGLWRLLPLFALLLSLGLGLWRALQAPAPRRPGARRAAVE